MLNIIRRAGGREGTSSLENLMSESLDPTLSVNTAHPVGFSPWMARPLCLFWLNLKLLRSSMFKPYPLHDDLPLSHCGRMTTEILENGVNFSVVAVYLDPKHLILSPHGSWSSPLRYGTACPSQLHPALRKESLAKQKPCPFEVYNSYVLLLELALLAQASDSSWSCAPSVPAKVGCPPCEPA